MKQPQNSNGIQEALKQLRIEMTIWRLHRKGVSAARKYANATELKLHLGCGPKSKPGWVNVDLNREADLTLDLRRGLPFQNGCCSNVYSEHFLEHLAYPGEANFFLDECCRVLKPGGEFSVGVPDTEWPLLEYAQVRDGDYFRLAKEQWHPEWCKTPLDHINYHFRQDGEHKYAYDFENLKACLSNAGFVDVNVRSFDPDLDSEDRNVGTLYVKAIAP